MSTCLDCTVGSHHYDVYLTVYSRKKGNDTVTDLVLKGIAEVSQGSHIYIIELSAEELNTLNVYCLVCKISESFLGCCGLQGIDLRVSCLELCLEMLDLIKDLGRISL